MSLLRNLKTFLSSPAVASDYVSYTFQQMILRRAPTRTFWKNVRVGGFANFSEFHTSRRAVSDTEYRFFSGLDLPEGALVDVGANLGIVTALMGHLWPDRTVHAFEPAPSTFHSLQDTVDLNDLSGIKLNNAAVGARAEELLFEIRPSSRATAKLSTASDAAANKETSISVPSIPLDTYADQNDIDTIALLKVDVEGFEPLVFEGAEQLLREQRIRVIYFELCPPLLEQAGFDVTRPARMLESHGYKLMQISEKGLEPVTADDSASVSLANWIAYSPGHLTLTKE